MSLLGDYIPNSWVMFIWDIYQPLYGFSYGFPMVFPWFGVPPLQTRPSLRPSLHHCPLGFRAQGVDSASPSNPAGWKTHLAAHGSDWLREGLRTNRRSDQAQVYQVWISLVFDGFRMFLEWEWVRWCEMMWCASKSKKQIVHSCTAPVGNRTRLVHHRAWNLLSPSRDFPKVHHTSEFSGWWHWCGTCITCSMSDATKHSFQLGEALKPSLQGVCKVGQALYPLPPSNTGLTVANAKVSAVQVACCFQVP